MKLSSLYEAGFTAGEQRAFIDRRNGDLLVRAKNPTGPYDRGFWDGYCPRSAAWAVPVRKAQGLASQVPDRA